MNTISGIDNLRKDLERQHGNMQGHIAMPICEKYEQRTADRLKDGAKKAEFAMCRTVTEALLQQMLNISRMAIQSNDKDE